VGDHHAVAAAERPDQRDGHADQLFFTAHRRATIAADAGGGYRGVNPKIAASVVRGKRPLVGETGAPFRDGMNSRFGA
jgi:hypothetical protein